MLEVEKHFQDPAAIMALKGSALEKQVRTDREALQLLGIRYVVLPKSSASPAQERFLQLIARRIERTGSHYFGELAPAGSSQ
jgi:hypothetical protein